uniref:Fatty-acid and retinol-binding protein 1 n=1 Tax=Pratylenchus penetrans TaxID=45929 RepID=A0A1U9IKX0_PRAPE|nr:fatty acid and retinol-binding protein [Pratylenchus penetrans]
MYKVICLLAFIAIAQAAVIPPLDLNSIPEEYRDLVPPEVTTFYNELTEEDKQILKEIASRHEEFQNEDQALEALKTKSEKLYNKAVELRNLVKGKIDALNPDAKEFVTGVIEKLKALRPKPGEKPNLEELRKQANEIVEKYKGLNDEAKESLKSNFPKITGIIQNEKFQNLAKSLLKPEGAAPAA